MASPELAVVENKLPFLLRMPVMGRLICLVRIISLSDDIHIFADGSTVSSIRQAEELVQVGVEMGSGVRLAHQSKEVRKHSDWLVGLLSILFVTARFFCISWNCLSPVSEAQGDHSPNCHPMHSHI